MNNLSGGYIMVDLASPNRVKQLEKAAALNKPLLVYYDDVTTEWGKVSVTYETVDDVDIPTYHITTANGFVTVEADGDVSARPLIVEGEIVPLEKTNVTFTYGKWSLCGTHLMIVLAGEVSDNVSYSQNDIIARVPLPKYIRDKIVPLSSANRVSSAPLKNYVAYSENTVATIALSKDEANERLNMNCWGTGTFTIATGTFRIQFDLLIDNE